MGKRRQTIGRLIYLTGMLFIGCAIAGLGRGEPEQDPNTFWGRIGVSAAAVKEIRLRYDLGETGQPSLTIPSGTAPYEALMEYLDCEIEAAEFSKEAYPEDPLSAILVTGLKEIPVHFITTEGRGERDSTLHLVWRDQVYQMRNQDKAEQLSPYHYVARDPLFQFLTAYAKRPNQYGLTADESLRLLPRDGGLSSKIAGEESQADSFEELNRAAEFVFSGRIESRWTYQTASETMQHSWDYPKTH